jgi:hypothetical protein
VLGGTVGALEETAGGLGIDAPLGDLTGPITDPLDRALNDVLDQRGPRDQERLDAQVGGTVTGLTEGLLGR